MRTLKISLLVFILSITISAQSYWKRVGQSIGGVICFAIDLSSNIYAGTSSGVFISTDNGYSWDEKNSWVTSTYFDDISQLLSTQRSIFL